MDNWVAAGSGRDRQWYRSRPLYEQAAVGAGVGAVGAGGRGINTRRNEGVQPAHRSVRPKQSSILPSRAASIYAAHIYVYDGPGRLLRLFNQPSKQPLKTEQPSSRLTKLSSKTLPTQPSTTTTPNFGGTAADLVNNIRI